jgi:hypothetical protein
MRPARSRPEGTVTITAVAPERMWASEAGIPFGRLRGENRYEPLPDGRIRVSKGVEVYGPFGPLLPDLGVQDARRHAQELRRLEAEARRRGYRVARANRPARSVLMSLPATPNHADP